ncbi:hypothetical protein AAW51_4665 [Caldimonas brevitalea]|uniref:Uncharacterized protein n=1 Tax=Caldimonas brevitalea TaxID=413882 RepID=A0A0G3BVG4_9BURK|nr:hypothetical protein AAW51_4665 [Caldimonas brevitalea]
MSPKLRTLLLLCDGHRSDAEVLGTTHGMGATPADLHELLTLGLIEPVGGMRPPPAPAKLAAQSAPEALSFAPTIPNDTAQRYQVAYRLATQLTSELGLRGVRLQLAVEAAMTLQDLQQLEPRLHEALLATHGPAKGADKARELGRALHGQG